MTVSARVCAQRLHTVKPGETLSSISRQARIAVTDLAAANQMLASQPLRAGQTLELPPAGVTYVRPGQTLSHIARAHHCTVAELRRINRLRANEPVRAGERLQLPGFVQAEVRDHDWGAPEQPGYVVFAEQAERARWQLVDEEGRVRLKGLRALGRAMGRGEDEQDRHVHPRLAVLLAKISDHFGGRPITIVSGFRAAGGGTRESSRHVAGRASDILVAGVPARLIWEYCMSLAQTGCGLYPNSGFVHVDVRESVAQWVDWSMPGKRARYGTLRGPYRRKQAKSPTRPRVTRTVTLADEVPLFVQVANRHNEIVRAVDEHAVQPAVPGEDEEMESDPAETAAAVVPAP